MPRIDSVALALALLLFATLARGQGVERVAWLQGCWSLQSGDRIVEEQWMAPRANTMLGMGRTVRGERLVEHESVVLRAQGSELHFEAHPGGKTPATFVAREASEREVIFESPREEFPQRVGYRRGEDDTLLAWIEGSVNGKARRVEFPYRRVPCPGASPQAR
jgi:hypothetical protein